MKIYVASSWRNYYQPGVVNLLRELGHEVYDFRNPPNGSGGFAWSDIDENWENWTTDEYQNALKHPIAEKGFNSDFDGMKWADACVMVLPCGRSANTEAGWMKGVGKKVFVYSPLKQEPELMYKIYDEIVTDDNFIKTFNNPSLQSEIEKRIPTLEEIKDTIAEFSDRKFGKERSFSAPLHHLKKEIDEVINESEECNPNPTNASLLEYADCLLLLLDSFRKRHPDLTTDHLLRASKNKIKIIEKRTYGAADANGVIEHIR